MRLPSFSKYQRGLAIASLVFAAAPASAVDYDFYASFRVQAEMVEPDNTAALGSYTGFRDAYSRIGANASHAINDSTTVYGKLEIPLDIPNGEAQYSFDHDESIRIAKVGIKGDFGNLSVGQMWMPYYNAIAYPVDMFSSYYSGFATFTTFRKGDTIAYYTPSMNGLSGAVAWSHENGSAKGNGDPDDRMQATVTYAMDNLTLAGGLDHTGGTNDSTIGGLSAMWNATDELYIGAKAERFFSDANAGFGEDGDTALNLYGGYTIGKNTIKAMIADVDKFGERVLHLGVDHQYSKDLKFFAEFYSEQQTAAIVAEGKDGFSTALASGGYVATVGFRYDFSAP